MVVERDPARSSIIDVLDRVLDKGIIVDASVRISLIGIELVGIDVRVVVASVETYLRHADALAYTGLAARPGVDRRTTDRRQVEQRDRQRRFLEERRAGLGRRIQNRRFAEVSVAVERRSGTDRRSGNARRLAAIRRAPDERRARAERRDFGEGRRQVEC